MTGVNLSALSKTYANAAQPALDDLSLDIAPGSLTALLGPSGCGKTTALKIIAGLLAPTTGNVAIGGKSVLSLPPNQRGAVMVFQNPLLFPHMTVAENIAFGLTMRRRPKLEIATKVAEMLALVQLSTLGARRPSQLSGGQAQCVALARALILKPQVLLLDEPLSNLDTNLRAEMRDLIRRLQRATGITTIFVTHDQTEAAALADQIALLISGRLQQYGPPDAFFKRPNSRTVAQFFGGTNFVTGQCSGNIFTSELGPLTLPEATHAGAGTLAIRPENIRFGAAQVNTVHAILADKTYLGTQSRLALQIGAARLDAIANTDDVAAFAVGMALPINLPPQALWLLP